MASTRLRKTFHYPIDSEDDAVEEGMDEQDQATLLNTLSNKDTSSTHFYTSLLLILPLAPVPLYIPQLFSLSTLLPSILSVTSLLATAYTLYYLPLPPVRVRVTTLDDTSSDRTRRTSDARPKRRAINRSATGFSSTPIRHETPPVPYISKEIANMLKTYVVPVNVAVCALFTLHEISQGRKWSQGMMIGGGYIPGFAMGIVMWARRELRVVDLGELERLRYASKGT